MMLLDRNEPLTALDIKNIKKIISAFSILLSHFIQKLF